MTLARGETLAERVAVDHRPSGALMGTLLAGLGHDMGNRLLPVRAGLDSLSAEPLSDQAREDLEAIGTAAESLRRLAAGLRLLSLDPRQSVDMHSTDVGAWWPDAEGVLRCVLPRGVSLEADLVAGLPEVSMSRAGLTRVVFDLVQNAGDAMRERGSGRVVIRARAESGTVLLSVIDNGPGMSPEVATPEMCTSTDSRAVSAGLGLAMAHELVRGAGGAVEVRSEPGVGTTFSLRLAAARPATAGGPMARAGSAVVTLGDPRMRSYVGSELRSLGIRVLNDAADADGHTLFILDDAARVSGIPATARALIFGQAPQRDGPTVCLTGKPAISSLRSALRDLAGQGMGGPHPGRACPEASA